MELPQASSWNLLIQESEVKFNHVHFIKTPLSDSDIGGSQMPLFKPLVWRETRFFMLIWISVYLQLPAFPATFFPSVAFFLYLLWHWPSPTFCLYSGSFLECLASPNRLLDAGLSGPNSYSPQCVAQCQLLIIMQVFLPGQKGSILNGELFFKADTMKCTDTTEKGGCFWGRNARLKTS